MFDSLKYAKQLEAAGITREQAEAHIHIIGEIVEGELATKQDIRELEHKLIELEYRLIIKLSAIVGTMITVAIALTAGITKLL
jgi:hypothetical protein